MTAFKAVVKVFAGEAKKISQPTTYRGGTKTESQVPLDVNEITGEVFAYTVTGHSIEEVSRKAKAMFDANTGAEQRVDVEIDKVAKGFR